MKVSIIVNTLNRLHTLPNTLDGLQRLRYPDLEVIIVNGPSTDGTAEYLSLNWGDKVKLLDCDLPNLSKSRNIGITAAAGDVIAFIDDDGIPEPDWIDQILPMYADNAVGGVGGFVRDNTGVNFQAKFVHSGRDGFSHCLKTSPVDQDRDKNPDVFNGLIGVNSTFRRIYLLEIGGFDEEYAYFLDETDVCVRLIEAGYKIVTVPSAEVHHKFAASHIRSQKGLPKTWYQIAKSTAYYCLFNRRKELPLTEAFESVWKHYYNCLQSTANGRSSKSLYGYQITNLHDTLNRGMREGIFDAVANSDRLLIDTSSIEKPRWKEFKKIECLNEKKYKIAFITENFPPRPCGGIAVFIRDLAENLAAAGHEVTILTFSAPNQPHTVDLENGVWVHRLSNDSPYSNIAVENMPDHSLRASQIILYELDRINERRNFDWIVSTIWDVLHAATIVSGRYKTATYLVTSYALMLDSKPEWSANADYFNNHVKKMIQLERWAINNTDLAFSSTSAILADSEIAYNTNIPSHRLSITPFGIKDLPNTPPPKKTCGNINILFVGRFERRKGIHVILDMIPELLKTHKDVEIYLIGDNSIVNSDGKSFLEEFRSQYCDNIWFDKIKTPGVVSDDDLNNFYANCDIFIAPSLYESFGLIYLEAMRCGKPCIGCDVGGIPEVIINGETGILVPPGDPLSLLDAIRVLMKNPQLRHNYGLNGRRRFEEFFSIDAFRDNFISALKKHDELNTSNLAGNR